eukprot:1144153-Pelagomonas_calceolata.AAC.2
MQTELMPANVLNADIFHPASGYGGTLELMAEEETQRLQNLAFRNERRGQVCKAVSGRKEEEEVAKLYLPTKAA